MNHVTYPTYPDGGPPSIYNSSPEELARLANAARARVMQADRVMRSLNTTASIEAYSVAYEEYCDLRAKFHVSFS